MRTTFAPFVLVLEWNRFVSLIQQLLQFRSRYWVYSVKMFPLAPFNLAGFRQTWLRELIRSLKICLFGFLAFLLWSIFVTHTAGQCKKQSARLSHPSHNLVVVRQAQIWAQQYHCDSSDR